MPLRRCQAEGLSGWRWGKRGKCYTGSGARARALKQARAIRASGFTGNVHRRIRTQIVPSNPLKADPTRSATLRRIFTTDFTRRFFALKSKILRLIVDEDAFGLRRPGPFTLFNKEQSDENQVDSQGSSSKSDAFGRVGEGTESRETQVWLESSSLVASSAEVLRGNGGLYSVNQRWAFQTDPQKVASFQQWLATQVQTDILTTTAENLENVYWQRYVEEGYRKGAGRAFDDTRKAALSSGADVSDFYQGTREEFLRSAFAQPVAIEKVKLLTGRVFTDLKGVTEAMSAQITRALADGLVQGQNPRKIASDLNKIVDGIGRRRATLIARTEIIRAHAEGQLDAFERLGVTKLGVMVEWSTAGDDRVCPLCQPLEGTVLSLKEARSILPRHPQCRCAYIPANVGESTKGQNRSPAEVRKAMDESIRAEIPKRQVGKRTLAQQKNRSPWAGADKTIAKKRPRGVLEPLPSKVSPKPRAKPKPKAAAKPLTPRLSIPKNLSKQIQEEHVAFMEVEAQKRGVSVAQLRRAADKKLQESASKSKVYIRADESSLRKILDDGRFKTQFEVGKSKGAFSPQSRRAIEERVMGISQDAQDQTRPIYGYLSELTPKADDVGNHLGTKRYGNAVIEMKSNVRKRTTVTLQDSVDSVNRAIASPIDDMSVDAGNFVSALDARKKKLFDARAKWSVDDPFSNYTEAQVHGGVSTSDIEKIWFKKVPSKKTQQQLKSEGISWEVKS